MRMLLPIVLAGLTLTACGGDTDTTSPKTSAADKPATATLDQSTALEAWTEHVQENGDDALTEHAEHTCEPSTGDRYWCATRYSVAANDHRTMTGYVHPDGSPDAPTISTGMTEAEATAAAKAPAE